MQKRPLTEASRMLNFKAPTLPPASTTLTKNHDGFDDAED